MDTLRSMMKARTSPKKVYFEEEQSSSDESEDLVQLHIQSVQSFLAKEAILSSKKLLSLLEKTQHELVETTGKYQRLQKKCQVLSSTNGDLKSENETLKHEIAVLLEAKKELEMYFEKPRDTAVIRTKTTDDDNDFGSVDDDDDKASLNSAKIPSFLSVFRTKTTDDDNDFGSVDDDDDDDKASLNSAKIPSFLSDTFSGLENPSSKNSSSSSSKSSTSGMSYYLSKAGADFTDVEDRLEENKELTLKILTDVLTVMKSLKEEINELKKEKKKLEESLQQKTVELEDAKDKATIESLTLKSSLQQEKKKKELMKMTVEYQEHQLKKFRDQIEENDKELLCFQKKLEEFRQQM